MKRQVRHDAWVSVRRWEAVVNLLGAKLARAPDDAALGKTLHAACDRLHELEIELIERIWFNAGQSQNANAAVGNH